MTTYSTNISDTTPFADYQFTVQATNQQGTGPVSMQSAAAQFNYNDGDGGSSYVEYDLDGKHWKGMKFENSGTFNVKVNAKDWRILVIGGGGSGNGGNNGAGGEVKNVSVPTHLINESQLTVTVAGAGGTSRVALKTSNYELASARGNCCGNGNTSWFNGTSRCFGGNGGKVWWNHCCPANGDAPGCCGGSWDCNGGSAGKCYGGGGGGVQHTQVCSQAGHKGHVIILWEEPV